MTFSSETKKGRFKVIDGALLKNGKKKHVLVHILVGIGGTTISPDSYCDFDKILLYSYSTWSQNRLTIEVEIQRATKEKRNYV